MSQPAPPMPPRVLPASDFGPLIREVRAHGLLDRSVRQKWAAALDLALYVGVFALVVLVGDTWWQLLLAVPAAVLATRIHFIGHDAGHGQLAGSRRANRLLGALIGDLTVGLSHGWWNDKHNRHHANPNHPGKDPDVGAGALVWTPAQASARTGGPARWLSRHQHRLFFPLLLLEGLNLKISSVRWVIAAASGRHGARHRAGARAEAFLLAVHVAGYLGLVFTVLSPGRAVAFVLLHQGILGVHLGCSFAPNHKGMPMMTGDERWDHLRKQVITSRNVDGGPAGDWFLGGLNHQIEHHLFPNMPRANLRRARPLVRAHCARLGLPYCEEGLLRSYARALGHLREAGEGAR